MTVAIFAFSFFFTHERVVEEEKAEAEKTNVREELAALFKNKYWLMVAGVIFILYFSLTVNGGGAVYFAKAVLNDTNYVTPLGNATSIAQIITMFVAAPLFIKRIGKKNGMLISMGLAAIGYAIAALVGTNFTLIMMANIIKGIGNGFAASCMWGMLSDTIEYGEWKTGIRSAGLANAASSFGSKVGSGIGGAVLGWIIAAGGYNAEAASQTASAITAVNIVYSYLPLVMAIISALILAWGYKLDKEYDTIINELEMRKHQK